MVSCQVVRFINFKHFYYTLVHHSPAPHRKWEDVENIKGRGFERKDKKGVLRGIGARLRTETRWGGVGGVSVRGVGA